MRRWLLRALVAIWLGWQTQTAATAQGMPSYQGYPVNGGMPYLGYAQSYGPQQGSAQPADMLPNGYVQGMPGYQGQPVYHDVQAPVPFGGPGGPGGAGSVGSAGGPYFVHDFSHPGWGQNGWTPYVYPPSPWGLSPDPYYPAASGKVEGCFLRRACLNCLNRCGTGCYATHNNIGCSSCYAQLVFAFGSCRQFYGTPCIPQPPKPHPCLDELRQKGLFRGELLGNQGNCGPNGVANQSGNQGNCAGCGGW